MHKYTVTLTTRSIDTGRTFKQEFTVNAEDKDDAAETVVLGMMPLVAWQVATIDKIEIEEIK